ncbi:MAG: PLP-dependent aminotransferase family protein [Lachnospiraceae bacterium]|nr:PLP-dependent aminotransferase family protein [Lachnospiraceae bacterium]
MLTYNVSGKNRNKTQYLYECIKADIRSGVLKAGDKLPSKRSFAVHIGVSAITVENAYAMLEEEGYIEARARSGFYVRDMQLPADFGKYRGSAANERDTGKPEGQEKTDKGFQIRYLKDDENTVSDEREIPQGMVKIMRQLLSERPEILLEKMPHMGCAALRNTIADYLKRYRGMNVQPANVIVGSGAEYLYGMLVQLFGRDMTFGIEYPSYEKIELVYKANGALTEHLKMGNDGILSKELAASKATVLHVSPYHSYPTGITASASKRYEYLSWAESRNGFLIEDDFDSEFAFLRKPIEPMFSMDNNDRVIYMNTFSKSIAPSIRVAYMVLPDRLMDRYAQHLGFYSCPVPVFDQYILSEYIKNGMFERHLNRIRRKLQETKA